MNMNEYFLQVILSSHKYSEKATEYNMMRPWLGDGLLTSSGSKWFARRKVITPAFHFKILEQFYEVFDKQSNILVQILDQYSNKGETFDIFPHITLYALDVICGKTF